MKLTNENKKIFSVIILMFSAVFLIYTLIDSIRMITIYPTFRSIFWGLFQTATAFVYTFLNVYCSMNIFPKNTSHFKRNHFFLLIFGFGASVFFAHSKILDIFQNLRFIPFIQFLAYVAIALFYLLIIYEHLKNLSEMKEEKEENLWE